MQPLVTTKRILEWISMYPVAKSTTTPLWKASAHIIIIVMMFGVTLCAIAAYTVYIIENISNNLEDCVFTFMAFVTCCGLIYAMIMAFFTRHQVPSIFQQLSSIYEDRNYSIELNKII